MTAQKRSKTNSRNNKKSVGKIGFGKQLLIADYAIAIAIIVGFFICVIANGIYAKNLIGSMVAMGIDVSVMATPQLFPLDVFGVLLGSWIIQLGVSSGAYYFLCKSEHKIQLPMQMIKEMPDDVKNSVDMTQIITSVLSMSN